MNSTSGWTLLVKAEVHKTLRTFPQNIAEKIRHVITILPLNPYAGDVEKLGGFENSYRRRIGSYRITYELYVSDRIIVIAEGKTGRPSDPAPEGTGHSRAATGVFF